MHACSSGALWPADRPWAGVFQLAGDDGGQDNPVGIRAFDMIGSHSQSYLLAGCRTGGLDLSGPPYQARQEEGVPERTRRTVPCR